MNHATNHRYGQKCCLCIHRGFSACPIAHMHLIFRYFHTWRQIWQSDTHLRSNDDSHAQWLYESRRNEAFLYTGTRGEGQPNPSSAQQSQLFILPLLATHTQATTAEQLRQKAASPRRPLVGHGTRPHGHDRHSIKTSRSGLVRSAGWK